MKRHTLYISICSLVSFLVMGFQPTAHAVTITFDGPPTVDSQGSILGGEYFETIGTDGMYVEAWGIMSGDPNFHDGTLPFPVINHGGFVNGGLEISSFLDTAGVGVSGIVIARLDGQPFNLISLDLQSLYTQPDLHVVADSGIPTSLPPSGWSAFASTATIEIITFTEFDNVTRVWIGAASGNTASIFIDNIVVPEPASATAIIFAAITVCLLGLWRVKSSKSVT